MKVLGVILARGGSKGIPRKNIHTVCGHPLIAYTIEAGLKSKHIDDLIVSTDSREIGEVAARYGAKVPFYRPDELAGDKVMSADALRHAVLETEKKYSCKYDYVVELPCVSPLRDHNHVDSAILKLINTKCDSVISMVCTGEKHPVRLKKIVDDRISDISTEYPEPLSGSRRQDLKPDAYIRNGAIYAMTRDTIINKHNRHGEDSRPYIMDDHSSVNIDTRFDLEMAEFLISKGYCNNVPTKKDYEIEWHGGERVANLLVTTPLHFMENVKEAYNKKYKCVFASKNTRYEKIKEILTRVEGWVCHPCPEYRIGEDLLRGSSIKFIASTSTGTSHIDVDYCERNDIRVMSLKECPDVLSISASSEFTFGLMLATMRCLPQSCNIADRAEWRSQEDSLRGVEVRGKTLGIIGYGRIGSNNAKYATAMGMRVIAYDPYKEVYNPDVEKQKAYQDVLTEADVVMICVHLDNKTKGMVNDHWFSLMKDGAYFINTSRGEVVDEAALIRHLKSGKLKAAGVDVISGEQSVSVDHPMLQYARENNNLIVTPHIAGLTVDSERKAAALILEKIGTL